ncbi:hypothetical protein [Nitrosomonas sp. Nm33]|uniref:hypothetical protein n=1 Tax=Nitrosomonas sp. Nm33 TaxID=133724 RepID=UPI000B80E1D5|nr:hypothetical protein [Nitrosomonas sp. Nm33]
MAAVHQKSGRLEPLMSRAGAIGIMQVNPNVWRGFYEIPALRNDISYNASAGETRSCTIILQTMFLSRMNTKKPTVSII